MGLAAAFKLQRRLTKCALTLLEKESAAGRHQSTHNSGVLHAGLYYRPGSAKARLAVNGIRQMIEFCQTHRLPHEVCGKLVVATEERELPRLKSLFERGAQNGLRGLRWLDRSEMLAIEPHAGGLQAIHVPEEGIVDYQAVCRKLQDLIQEGGGRIATQAKVAGLKKSSQEWVVQTAAGDFAADYLINCAGLHCDRIARLAGEKPGLRIVPFRGEYYKIKPERSHLVRSLIYPAPDPEFPFLGVHFTRLIHGGIEAGPNAVLAFAREGYTKFHINPRDLWDSLAYPGLWSFVWQHRSMCWFELRRSCSRDLFCRSLQKLVPDIRPEDLETGGAGVRAQAIFPDGKLADDFSFAEKENALHVLNAPSPAATASLAIGDAIAAKVAGRWS